MEVLQTMIIVTLDELQNAAPSHRPIKENSKSKNTSARSFTYQPITIA